MPYQVTVDKKPGYLHVKVTGDNTAQTLRGYLAEIRETCTRLACPDVLIEENLDGPSLDMLEVYFIISEESTKTHPAVRNIAFTDTNIRHKTPLREFAETVAVNRGVNVRIFPDVPSAEAWLKSEARREHPSPG